LDENTITAQNRRGKICPVNRAIGAPSFSPYRVCELLKLLSSQVDTEELEAMLQILSPAG
jgi:hypothetical protein